MVRVEIIGQNNLNAVLDKEGDYLIGREVNGDSSRVLVKGLDGNGVIAEGANTVSKTHVRLWIKEEKLFLFDLSKNGSYLNGRRFAYKAIKESSEYSLRLGDSEFVLRYSG